MERMLNISLFSLFHHDVLYLDKTFAFNSQNLYSLLKKETNYEIKEFAEVFQSIVAKNINGCNSEEISLTLTGGMDSRIILACLLKAGIKPNCLTFGNPNTKDVVFAKQIAESFNLPFHNSCQKKPTKDWYYKWVVETIKRDNGNAHLHRAHRTAAIAEHTEKYDPTVLFTGHMGGEGLRGLTYNNYFASPFFEIVNEEKTNIKEAARKVLHNYFVKTENINYDALIEEILSLPWMKHDKKTNNFFFLYELVAKIHHAQDIRLFNTYIPRVIPVYLQNNYLETLFSSNYHFMAKGNGLIGRLKNPYVYCKLLEIIYPKLLDYPLANGYTPREYQKGLLYYVPLKFYRDFTQNNKYPPSFSYGIWYQEFVKEHANNINPEIWDIFDKNRYMHALYNNVHRTDEGYWHKFSNPIYFDLVEKYKRGEQN